MLIRGAGSGKVGPKAWITALHLIWTCGMHWALQTDERCKSIWGGFLLKTTIDSLGLIVHRISWVAWSGCWSCPELAQVLLTLVEKTSHSPHSWLEGHTHMQTHTHMHTAGSCSGPAAAATATLTAWWTVAVKHLELDVVRLCLKIN